MEMISKGCLVIDTIYCEFLRAAFSQSDGISHVSSVTRHKTDYTTVCFGDTKIT